MFKNDIRISSHLNFCRIIINAEKFLQIVHKIFTSVINANISGARIYRKRKKNKYLQ